MASELKYRPELDGLRALAVTTVVLYHAFIPGFQGGFMGVDVFFVLSGYLITGLLYGEISQSNGRLDWVNFYARRVRRLTPAAFLVVMFTLFAACLVLWPTGELQELAKSAAASALWSANIWFQFHGLNYFDGPGRGRELLHLWSLGVEEQFYLVWPWFLLLVAALARSVRLPRVAVFVGVLLLATALSFGLNLALVHSNQPAAFFQMPLRAFELSIGGLFTLLPAHRTRPIFGWLGFALLLAAFYWVDESWVFPGATALLPSVATALMLWAFTAPHWLAQRLFTQPLAIWIGKRSYSWYLWHWPLLALWRDYRLGDVSPWQSLVVCAVALLAAHLGFVWLEMPARHGQLRGWKTNRGTLWSGAALLLIMLVTAAGVEIWAKFYGAKQPVAMRIAAEFKAYDTNGLDCMNATFADWHAAFSRPECHSGPAAGHAKLFLWGDSHAGAQRALAQAYASTHGFELIQRTAPGCAALLNWYPWNTTKKKECLEFTDAMLKEVQAARAAGDAVGLVLANRWPNMVTPERLSVVDIYLWNIEGKQRDFAKSNALFGAGLDASFSTLTQLGVPILVIGPVPEMRYDIPRCLARYGEAQCRMPRQRIEAHRAFVVAQLKAAAGRSQSVRYADPLPLFCDADWCYARRDGVTLYVDDDHLSATASKRLLPMLSADFDWLAATARASAGVAPVPSP